MDDCHIKTKTKQHQVQTWSSLVVFHCRHSPFLYFWSSSVGLETGVAMVFIEKVMKLHETGFPRVLEILESL